MAQNIYRATDYEILPLNPDISVSSPPHPVEAHLLALVKSHLSSGNFLFSYAWDLTRRLQAQWASLKEDGDKPLWEVVSVASFRLRAPTQYYDYCRLTTGSSGTSKLRRCFY